MGSDFWKELDPRGDAQIPGGEDGNDFFFLIVGSCYWWKNWPAGTEFLLCVTDHLPRPDSFWILRVQNPNAGRPRLNLSLVHCPTSSISQIKILKLNSPGTEIMPFWRTKKKSWGIFKPSPSTNEEPKLQPLCSLGCSNNSSIPGKPQQLFLSCPRILQIFECLKPCWRSGDVWTWCFALEQLQLGTFWWHRHRARSCLPFPVSLGAPLGVGFDPFEGRWVPAKVSPCRSLIQMNSEENSSQQPPGMRGGGRSSGWFFHKVFPGFWFGNPEFKWKIRDWDKIDLRSSLSWFCLHKPQTILVCSSQKWGRKPPKLSSDPSSKFFWCSR